MYAETPRVVTELEANDLHPQGCSACERLVGEAPLQVDPELVRGLVLRHLVLQLVRNASADVGEHSVVGDVPGVECLSRCDVLVCIAVDRVAGDPLFLVWSEGQVLARLP